MVQPVACERGVHGLLVRGRRWGSRPVWGTTVASMPPRPLPPWVTAPDRPVTLAVLVAGHDTLGRQAARAARAFATAGADGVEVVLAPGVDPATSRCSPAELVAAIAEEHIPVGLAVTSSVGAHLGVGAGAAWLRVDVASLDDALAETLSGMGRPTVVAALLDPAPTGDADLGSRLTRARSRPELVAFDAAQLLVEVPAGNLPVDPVGPLGAVVVDLCDMVDRATDAVVAAGSTGRSPSGGVSHGVTTGRSSADGESGHELHVAVLSAAATLAIRAGARILRTDDPGVVHVAAAVSAAVEDVRR